MKNGAFGYSDKQSQNKPNSNSIAERTKLTQTLIHKRNTKINGNGESEKTKPIQSQLKPKQTQFQNPGFGFIL